MRNVKDVAAYILAKRMNAFEEYDELWDEFYHYMDAYLNHPDSIDVIIYADLIENLIGVRKHEDIIKEIFSYGDAFRFKE